MEIPADLLNQAKAVIETAKAQGRTLAVAESCTGGLIGGCLTAVPGSSSVFLCGFSTYSNSAKSAVLGVPRDAIEAYGAVSDVVAAAMAEGAMAHGMSDLAVSVTGIAGPDGGTKDKPVGLVYLGIAERDRDARVKRYVFAGTRADIRRATVASALEMVHERLLTSNDP